MKVFGQFYHGSPQLFEEFYTPTRFQPNMQLGFGIHLAKSKEFAMRYGRFLYRCQVNLNNAFSMNHIYNAEKDLAELAFAKRLYRNSRDYRLIVQKDGEFVANVDVTAPKTAVKLLKEFGFDGVLYTSHFGSRAVYGMSVLQKSESVVCLSGASIQILDWQEAVS
jgi:hypothetical protein